MPKIFVTVITASVAEFDTTQDADAHVTVMRNHSPIAIYACIGSEARINIRATDENNKPVGAC